MRRVLLGVAAVLALAGCDRPATTERAKPPPAYTSSAEVRDALIRSGLSCTDFQPVGVNQRDFGEEDASENASCRVDDEDISISIWRSLGQKQDWARTRATLGCQFAASIGSPVPTYVDGGWWTIRVPSRMLATRISEAIGGTATFTDCRSVQ